MTFWRNRNVFVTGATGLLGSWLVEDLVQKGANIVCLIRDWVPASRLISTQLLDKVNIVRGELEDYNILLRSLNEYEINTVFHLGAQAIVGTSSRSALSTFESNIKGTWNMLEACKTCGSLIERVVIASSDKAYGSHDVLPYREGAPLQGRYPYDVSKSCADLLSLSYFYTYGVPLAITRCGNLFGGGDLSFNRLIPGTIRSAFQNQAPVIRSDGKFVRDYFFVKDAVKAYVLLAEQLPNCNFVGQAFNFGPERPMSVLEIVQLILKLMDKQEMAPVILNQATLEIYRQYLDCSKARQMLSWEPQFTLEDGLTQTISWYKHYFENT